MRAVFVAAFLISFRPVHGQTVTGSLTATVQDQAGAVVPMAEATLTHQATGVTIPSKTNEAGIVLFPGLTPGVYTLKITAAGFRTYVVRDISVTANERRTLGTITLQLGQVQESVDVVAEATPVQTASSERSGLIAGDQILNIAIKGRDFLGLMSTLPGVIDTNVGSRELVAHAAAADPRLRRPHGIAYTFSKALGVGSADFSGVSPYFSMRARNYGLLGYDATHALVINYTYELPNLAARWHNGFLNQVFGYWQLSGITTFQSGFPFTPGFSTSDAVDLTGSSESARITILGDPKLPKDQWTFDRTFRTEMFARTAQGDFGSAGVGLLRGPGIENFDISVTKRLPITERRYSWFRAEFFNAFNHTQFYGISTTARFDPAGNQINPNFGAYTSAHDPRRIQLSLRFMF